MATGENTRVGCETLVTTNRVVLAGEVRGPIASAERMEELARKAVREIGYEQDTFHWRNMSVECFVHSQSADIAQEWSMRREIRMKAGDQGLMFGYACRETPALMPAPIHYCHEILKSMAAARHSGELPGIGPDSKVRRFATRMASRRARRRSSSQRNMPMAWIRMKSANSCGRMF